MPVEVGDLVRSHEAQCKKLRSERDEARAELARLKSSVPECDAAKAFAEWARVDVGMRLTVYQDIRANCDDGAMLAALDALEGLTETPAAAVIVAAGDAEVLRELGVQQRRPGVPWGRWSRPLARATIVDGSTHVVLKRSKARLLLSILDSFRAMAALAITHQTTKGGQTAGIPRMSGVPMSTLRMIERDCRHTIERMPPVVRSLLDSAGTVDPAPVGREK